MSIRRYHELTPSDVCIIRALDIRREAEQYIVTGSVKIAKGGRGEVVLFDNGRAAIAFNGDAMWGWVVGDDFVADDGTEIDIASID